jgi:hypothetical protein
LLISRRYLASTIAKVLAAITVWCVAAPARADFPKGNLEPTGIGAMRDGTILLFASYRPCGMGADATVGRVFASNDRGKSWKVAVTDNDGAIFQYLYESPDGREWIAGTVYREGPNSDPFILVPTASPSHWQRYRIYSGPAELEEIGFDREHHLAAVVRHLKLGDQGWTGPTFIHKSDNDGRSWSVGGTRSRPFSQSFQKVLLSNRDWRVIQDAGHPLIQRRQDGAQWQTVAQLDSKCSE